MKRLRVVLCLLGLVCLPLICGAATTPTAGREDELRKAVVSYIQARTAGLGWETRIKRITHAGRTVLPEGPLDLEVVAPQQWEGWGGVNLTVYVRQNDRLVANVSLRVEVEALADMVVLLRQLDAGSLIVAGDVAVQRRDVATVSGRFLRSPDDAVGKKARVTLKANQPLKPEQVEKVPLVKSGQLVTIVAENDVLKVSVAGKARGNGALGDIIMVQNLNSMKEIPARVISASTVQVAF